MGDYQQYGSWEVITPFSTYHLTLWLYLYMIMKITRLCVQLKPVTNFKMWSLLPTYKCDNYLFNLEEGHKVDTKEKSNKIESLSFLRKYAACFIPETDVMGNTASLLEFIISYVRDSNVIIPHMYIWWSALQIFHFGTLIAFYLSVL